jgi:hypothetical protein
MTADLTAYDADMKDNYGPGLKNALNNQHNVLNEVPINTQDIVGRQAVWALHATRSASTSARGEGGTLASADSQGFNQLSRKLVFNYHTIKVTGPALHLTQGDEGAFVRALETELKGAESDIKNDRARQQFGQALTDGTVLQSGVIADVVGDPGTGTTITVSDQTKGEFRFWFQNIRIDFIDPATGNPRSNTPAGGYKVTAVDASAKTLTISSACDASVADEDYVVRYGNFGKEVDGLRQLVSTNKYAGVDPASVPSWGSVTDGSSTSQISELLLNEASEKVQTDGNGAVPDIWIAEFDQRRKLAAQLQAQKRYDGMQKTLTSGWKGLDIAEGTLVVDRFCPTNDIFGVTTADLARFVALDWSWDDDSGSTLYKALDDSDAIQARYRVYDQLAATNRNSHCRLTVATPTF